MRKLLLALGALLVLAGFALTVAWFNQPKGPRTVSEAQKPEAAQPRILTATRPISAGTLLRQGDVTWKQVPPNDVRSGYLVQNQSSDGDYVAAITRRDFAKGEALNAADLVKASDQNFLAATLSHGMRAVSLSFEQQQAGSGLAAASSLVLPGDHVDVILTQVLETAGDPARRMVGETVLRNLRVVALDRTFGVGLKAQSDETKPPVRGEVGAAPRTVTLEVTERQAEALFVASQLGKLHLSVLPVVDAGPKETDEKRGASVSTWASDVSPALLEYTPRSSSPATTGSSIESSIRRLPAPDH
jgi:pilus assembly protein CpaB